MKRDIVIDADHILFMVALSNAGFSGEGDGDFLGFGEVPTKPDITLYKDVFKDILNDYVSIAQVEIALRGDKEGKTRVIMSDDTNFRYELFPEYKNKRPSTILEIKLLKKWAMKKYTFIKNTEADDVVAHYVRKGAIGFTTDKDLLYGVAGIWFNSHYMTRAFVYTSKEDAEYFFKQQSLAGDGVDNIPAISGVGLITADKLLKKHGETWDDILRVYEIKGYDKDYMVCMVRLVCMTQWSPKKGIQLWQFPNQK